ncbi:MAG: hypothetical protein GF390_04065 [Candidatus Pacebacteria bacterium]|nr:hypothetical protein [Candidatus Paceibacterota bacterium]
MPNLQTMPANDSYVNNYSPPGKKQPNKMTKPAAQPSSTSAANAVKSAQSSSSVSNQSQQAELLEEQNIFELLGVKDGTEAEKEQFLDELQQVIWEDFLENDVDLLVTTQEMNQVNSIQNQVGKTAAEKQTELVSYLAKLVPDLEEIMLEKALELKEEMVFERVKGMKDFYAGQTQKLQQLEQAEQLFRQDQWASGAKILNSLS